MSDPQGFLKSEIGFIDVILFPLFEAANEFMKKDLDNIVENLRDTREKYSEKFEVAPESGKL